WKRVWANSRRMSSRGDANNCHPKSARGSMIYMLDTDTCIYTIKKNPPAVFENLRRIEYK
ncbi:MAG: hypothetical protein PHS17_08255, partial [Desulfobacterales bacterium]|nr:hypothetical protein [Desulfobacterales bacterium]